jgi:hypothetical protein
VQGTDRLYSKEMIGLCARMYVGAQEGDDRLHKEMVDCSQGTG